MISIAQNCGEAGQGLSDGSPDPATGLWETWLEFDRARQRQVRVLIRKAGGNGAKGAGEASTAQIGGVI